MSRRAHIARSAASLSALLGLTTAAAAGPLEDFKAIAQRCQQAHDARPQQEAVYVDKLQAWVKRVYSPATVKYDVRSTDSLVSPFAAELQVRQMVRTARAGTEDAARAIEPPVDTAITQERRLTFAYQDGAWRLQQARQQSEFKGRISSFALSVPELQKDTTPLRSCF